jgi:GH25 family lysozyme M1 (1,4-beta-N-acetylmuramidase)
MAIIGLDYASVDGNKTPDFAAAKAAGARFMLVRAIYGRGGPNAGPYCDPCWARDKDAIVRAGLKRGAYLFLCFPRKGATTPTPEAQAQAFIDYVKLDVGRDFPPVIDVEEASDVITADEMFSWVCRAAQILKNAYGTLPMIYTSARVWHENLKDHAAGVLKDCPLWLAKPWPWAIGTPVQLGGAPSYYPYAVIPFGDSTYWWIYQYQGDGTGMPGFTSTVDLDRFQLVKKGMAGDIVRWVQRRIGVTVDGIFGAATEAAVKSVQTRAGLAADGIVGPDTFAVLAWLAV